MTANLDTKALRALEAKATPGPWGKTPFEEKNDVCIWSPEGKWLANVGNWGNCQLVVEGENGPDVIPHPELERIETGHDANAELIVALRNAAPELLDAAEERDKYRTAATVLCGAHIGLPQSSCPVCERDGLREKLAEAERVMESHGGAGAIDYYRSDRDRAERATWAAKAIAEEAIRKNDALLAERDALRAEVATLREDVRALRALTFSCDGCAGKSCARCSGTGVVGLIPDDMREIGALRAEVAKLQLSASDVEFHGNEQVKALRAENERLREALDIIHARVCMNPNSPLKECPDEYGLAKRDTHWCSSCIARAALRSEKGEVQP